MASNQANCRFFQLFCLVALSGLGSSFISGCSSPSFEPNRLAAASYLETQDSAEVDRLAASVGVLIEEIFGTPDAPKWPDGVPMAVEMEEVERCAGPVGRAYDKVERGLYRKHCVQCHGITGDGAGPAASLLAPYPRDFRRGTFKFKSTSIGSKPIRSDLIKTIEHGLPGTSMPAFQTLRNRPEFEHDIESLVEYVVFLSIRGEAERRLLKLSVDNETQPSREEAIAVVSKVSQSWIEAPDLVVDIPVIPEVSPEEFQASVERGKTLFTSDKASCFKCHGYEGKGDGVSQDYDEWTKDWTIRVGIDPAKKSEWKVMKPFGALKPVVDRSRNFSLGGLRGGSTEQDIVKRIVLGVDGTPMPAATFSETDPNAFSLEDVFDLARYVASLGRNTTSADAGLAVSAPGSSVSGSSDANSSDADNTDADGVKVVNSSKGAQ
ncbi:c-type cytochrome [Pirellulaceae bacterium SH449]